MSSNEILMSLEMGLIYGIIAIGIYITFRVINFPDLTCDGSFVLGAAVATVLLKAQVNPWLTLLTALFAGFLAGAGTALLHIRLRITHLLAGILVSFMLYSINLRVMGGVPNIALFNDNTVFSNSSPLLVLMILALIIAMLLIFLFMTDLGLALRSISHNKKTAQNNGVNVATMTLFGVALSNGIIALGGALFSQHQGFADVGSGVGTLIVGLASVMLGERLLPTTRFAIKIISVLIGSIFYRLLITLALHIEGIGLTTSDLNLMTGILIILIMRFARSPHAKT